MKKVIIDNIEYEVDSSGARPNEYYDGIRWKLNGKVHRVDGPAVIWPSGDKEWYQNGLRHNLKGPAFIDSNGDQKWYIKGKCIGRSEKGFTKKKFEKYLLKNHNIILIDGKDYEIDSSGAKPEKYGNGICWKLNDLFHRVDGPAVIDNGAKYWYQNGELHNLKGPAIIHDNGDQEWCIEGKCIGRSTEGFTQEEFEEYLLKNHNIILIDGQEYEVDSSGAKPENHFNAGICWKLNGLFHRVDGPALIMNNGIKIWYQNGQYHNIKGPAIIRNNEDQEWYIEGKLIGKSKEGFTQEKFELHLKNDTENNTENNSNTKTILGLLGICNAANLLADNFKSKSRAKNSPILEEVVLDKNQDIENVEEENLEEEDFNNNDVMIYDRVDGSFIEDD